MLSYNLVLLHYGFNNRQLLFHTKQGKKSNREASDTNKGNTKVFIIKRVYRYLSLLVVETYCHNMVMDHTNGSLGNWLLKIRKKVISTRIHYETYEYA